jgi:hypothetical protein
MSGEAENEGPESHSILWRTSISRRLCVEKERDTRALRWVSRAAWLLLETLHNENYGERAPLRNREKKTR